MSNKWSKRGEDVASKRQRSYIMRDMIVSGPSGGFHNDKRDKRGKRAKEWKQDLEEIDEKSKN